MSIDVRRAAERVGSAATAGGNWVWNASSKATNALKGDAITVRMMTSQLESKML